jgi:hypothetical protein
MTQNRTEVTNIKVELFDEGKVTTVMTSPLCDLWRTEGRVTTKSGIILKRDNLEMQSESADWLYKEKKGVLKGNVKVVVSNFEFGAKPGTRQSAESGSLLLKPLTPKN